MIKRLSGTVRRLIFWRVADNWGLYELDDGRRISSSERLCNGDRFEADCFVSNGRIRLQKLLKLENQMTRDAMLDFLCKHCKGLGPKTLKPFIDALPEDYCEAMDEWSEDKRQLEHKLGPKRAETLKACWRETMLRRMTVLKYQTATNNTLTIDEAHRCLEADIRVADLASDPYAALEELLSFVRIDEIGRAMGIHDHRRLQGAVRFVLRRMLDAELWLSLEVFYTKLATLIPDVPPIDDLSCMFGVYYDPEKNQLWHIESREMHQYCANRLAEMQPKGQAIEYGIDAVMQHALQHRLILVRGHAGTGKTTLISRLCKKIGTPILLAPTGRAATRIAEKTHLMAYTMHYFCSITKEPIHGATLIIDEMAMVSTDMLAMVLRKCGENCAIYMFGDDGQLPPIRSGCVFEDLLLGSESSFGVHIQQFVLKQVFRQADNELLRNAEALYHGQICWAVNFEQGDHFSWLSERKLRGDEARLDYCADYVQKHGIEEVQILSPSRAFCAALNERIQDLINPDKRDAPFRINDYAICTKNCYNEEGLYAANGETGFITHVLATQLVLQTERGNDVTLERMDVELAYALTVHKSQGSEWPTVIVVLPDKVPKVLLYKRLLYTAITRASNNCILIGGKNIVKSALR